MTKDIRVEVKVRNNLVLTKMEEGGIKSIAELCRLIGVPSQQTPMGLLISMKVSARDKNDDWIPLAIKLADFFQCMPEDLFSEPQQRERLERNRAYAEVTFTELQQITSRSREPATPEIALQAQNLREAISRALQSLTPREERVLRLRFGFGGEELTLEEIGEMFDRNKEVIRQIEARALRKLKHPSRVNTIIAAGGDKKMLRRKSSKDDSEHLATEYTIDDEVLKAV